MINSNEMMKDVTKVTPGPLSAIENISELRQKYNFDYSDDQIEMYNMYNNFKYTKYFVVELKVLMIIT